MRSGRIAFALLAGLLSACGASLFEWRLPRPSFEALRPQAWPEFGDDSDRSSLLRAVDQSLDQLARLPDTREYELADRIVRVAELRRTLETFRAAVISAPGPIDWPTLVRDRFEVVASSDAGEALFTGYYAPQLPASRTRTSRFRYPIYRLPDDLVDVRLGMFCPACAGTVAAGRIRGRDIVPYYTREQIEAGALIGREAELAWLEDPIERFFLHVQGSALLRFEDGSFMHVSYSGSNGRPYTSIGKVLVAQGRMSVEDVSLESLKQYLHGHSDEREALFNTNERYIFFRAVPVGPIGGMGVPLTPGRSIAVDPSVYPLGSLVFIRADRPATFDRALPLRRFVLAQDTGAAITGPARVDVYWGSGQNAEKIAGSMRSRGEIHMLLAR